MYNEDTDSEHEIIPQNVTIFGLNQDVIEEEDDSMSEHSTQSESINNGMDTVPIVG